MKNKLDYILCPRCELNYFISNKNQKYCTVCLAEMNKADPNILIPEDEDGDLEILCPACKINYMSPDEEMCFICAKEQSDKAADGEVDWEKIEEEPAVEDEPIEISLSELKEEEEREEENEPVLDDDFEDDFFDDFDDFDDDFEDDFEDGEN